MCETCEIKNQEIKRLHRVCQEYRNDMVGLAEDIQKMIDVLRLEANEQNRKAAEISGDKWLEGATRGEALSKKSVADRLEDIFADRLEDIFSENGLQNKA